MPHTNPGLRKTVVIRPQGTEKSQTQIDLLLCR